MPCHPSTGLGSSRGRAGPWWPSRSARRAARCCCVAPSTVTRSVRRTGARSPITGLSSTLTIRTGGWRAEPSAVEEVNEPGSSEGRVVVEAPAAFAVANHPTIAPPHYRAAGLPADFHETVAIRAAAEALRPAVEQVDGDFGRDVAAAAWHAESVVRFFCSTYGGAVARVRVNEDRFIVLRAEVPGDHVTDARIAVGPDGTYACKVSTADGDRASAAPDVRAFEQVVASRLGKVGVQGRSRSNGLRTSSS